MNWEEALYYEIVDFKRVINVKTGDRFNILHKKAKYVFAEKFVYEHLKDFMLYKNLIDLLKIVNQNIVANYIEKEIVKYGFETSKDKYGNLYCVRGKAKKMPLLNAHMDIITNINEKHKKIGFKIENEKEIIITNETINTSLGGDDRCGIAIILHIAKTTKIPMKILFTKDEEKGCKGILYAIDNCKKFFNNIEYSITIDRKGFGEIVVGHIYERFIRNNFLASLIYSHMDRDIEPKIVYGFMSDFGFINRIVEKAVNISCGYYEPHSHKEYVIVTQVTKTARVLTDFMLNYKEENYV
jgi:di/tripeptidase